MTNKQLFEMVKAGNASIDVRFGSKLFMGSLYDFMSNFPDYPDYKHLKIYSSAIYYNGKEYPDVRGMKSFLLANY